MSRMILVCGSLVEHVMEAQRREGTDWPMEVLDRRLHADPKAMRQRAIEAMEAMPPDVDTVLVAMGFCGGSWDRVSLDRRVVIPRADDCVTLLLHTESIHGHDLKQKGHLYVKDRDPRQASFKRIFEDYTEGCDPEGKELIFHRWFDSYDHLDVIDAGLYDCHDEGWLREIHADAEWLGATVEHVEGSMILLEDLVSGRWDDRFLIAGPGEMIRRESFFGA